MFRWLAARRASSERRRVFDGIYDEGNWGVGEAGERRSGRGSHDPVFVEAYVDAVNRFLAAEPAIQQLVDLGCGDFNVGRHFLNDRRDYLACDISDLIIEQNRRRFCGEPVRFKQHDLVIEALPRADVGFLRQVLQHLPNADVSAVVDRLNRERPYRWVVVTEHVPAGAGWTPNRDMAAGAVTRLLQGSGLDLEAPPFQLHYREARLLCEVPAPDSGQDALLRTVAYGL